jgi:penicillin V acylase-like amidase (Ntn superfamily)
MNSYIKGMKPTLACILFLLFNASPSVACTTFCIHTKNDLVFGKNFDFGTGVGHVVVNKRGMLKNSYSLPSEKKLTWVSKFGSVTFNQMGREFPYGGINEKGLVIEIMWLADTKYPEADDRHGVTELQWIQYQLDNFSTVEEVLKSNEKIRISKQSKAPVHFMVVDAKGNKATIEYINGSFVAHTGDKLPVCVLTNNTYSQSTKHLNNLIDKGEKGNGIFRTSSFDRFAEASFMLKNFKGGNAVDYAFNVLSQTFQPNYTRWSIVYDIKNLAVHFRTLDNPDTRTFKLSEFDFSCSTPSLFINIEDNMEKGRLAFKPYSVDKNRELIRKAFSEVDFLQGMTQERTEVVVKYPETTKCN